MDDGYKSGNGLVLCTESFSKEEIALLKTVLESKFDLKVSLHIRRPSGGGVSQRIYISSESMKDLKTMVLPYFLPSMYYKLNL